MFKCQGTCKSSGLRPNKVVVERKMVKHVGGGTGSQIVRELSLCDGCATQTPEVPIVTYEPDAPLKAAIGNIADDVLSA